jgi:hypothetical protein
LRTHTIRINASAHPGRYSVDHNGKTLVEDTGAPVLDAARSLKASGVDEHDMIHVAGCPDITLLPASIHSILKPRKPPRQSEIRAALGMAR